MNLKVKTMRYALRNQDKIVKELGENIFEDMKRELDLKFKESGVYQKWDQEKGLYFLETRGYTFYILGIKYDVYRLAFGGIKE